MDGETKYKTEKTLISATNYVMKAEETGLMPYKKKDDLVPFEKLDLERIEKKIERARMGETTKDYQSLAFLSVGVFFTIITFLASLYLSIPEIPKLLLFFSLLALFLSLALALIFWSFSKKLGKLNQYLLDEVLDEIRHLKNKFQYTYKEKEEATDKEIELL